MCIIWWTTGCPHCRRLIPVQLVQTGHGSDEPQAFVDIDTTTNTSNTTNNNNQIPLYRLGPAQPETHKIHSIWRCYEVDTRLSVKESLSRSMAADMENGAVAGVGVGAGFEAGGALGTATTEPANCYMMGLVDLSSWHPTLNHNSLDLTVPHTGPTNPGVVNPAPALCSNLHPVQSTSTAAASLASLSSIKNKDNSDNNNSNNNNNNIFPGAALMGNASGLPQTHSHAAQGNGIPSGNLPSMSLSPGPLPPGFPPPVLQIPPPGSYSHTFSGHGGPLPSLFSPSLPLYPIHIPCPTNLSGPFALPYPLPFPSPSPHFSNSTSGTLPSGPLTCTGQHMPDPHHGQQVLHMRKGGLESFRLCPFLEHLDASDPSKKHPRESCWLTRCRKGKVGIVDGIGLVPLQLPTTRPSGTGQGRGMGHGHGHGQGHGQGHGNGQGQRGGGGQAQGQRGGGGGQGHGQRGGGGQAQGQRGGGGGHVHAEQVSGLSLTAGGHAGSTRGQGQVPGRAGARAGATSRSTGHHHAGRAGRGLAAAPDTNTNTASASMSPNHPEGDNGMLPRGANGANLNRNANPNPNANQHQDQHHNRDFQNGHGTNPNPRRVVQWWKIGWFKLGQFYLPVGGRGSRLMMSDIEG
ncbi:hypothetical protein QBC32DRAFT_365019 [Pseudoneurospora amorphoporcata]|uniref:Uncharacterized protein n=1 Tax=Pseudoneurospora amorphoporcata TaxID=241081 RepID=A0AAN6NNZ8_9PEZI|nr:hypothetical protein QBC32DRAFT_365019 [Pseudoneurospora amorphoporcata]